MSTVSDENTGPGVPQKEMGGQDGVPVSALKQSNKANIMSPPLSPQKKVNKADGPSSQDLPLIKEHLDQTSVIDSSLADDDDIISFKPPENFAAATDEVDPFKPGRQLANSPSSNKPQAVSQNPVFPAGSTLEAAQHQPGEEGSECGSGEKPSQPNAGEGGTNTKGVAALTDLDPLADRDPFKPKTQLLNSPEKASGSVDLVEDASKQADHLAKPVAETSEKNDISDVVHLKQAGEVVTSDSSDKIPSKLQSHQEVAAELDSFKPSSQLTNSLTTEDFDPFKTKSQIPNSPVAASADLDPFKPNKQLANSPDKVDAELDPFKPNTQLENSPERHVDTADNADPVQPTQQQDSSPKKPADVTADSLHHPRPSADTVQQMEVTQLSSSGVVADASVASATEPCSETVGSDSSDKSSAELVDALKPQQQPVNSPDKSDISAADPLKPKSRLVGSPSDNSVAVESSTVSQPDADLLQLQTSASETASLQENVDVLKGDSPSSEKEDISGNLDPFRPKTQLENTPSKGGDGTENVEPFKPKTQLANSPLKIHSEKEVDPFKPKSQLANSNQTEDITSEFDPFKPKTRLSDSPAKAEGTDVEADPFKPKSQIVNSPTKMEDIKSEVDPFKPKTQLANSPGKADIHSEVDPFQPKAQLAISPAKTEDLSSDVDPFKAKTQLVNSPAQGEGNDTEVDPFKPKTQLSNSPANVEGLSSEVDPLKPRAQLANSPSKAEGIDEEVKLFKPKAQLANSPAKTGVDTEVDPFKPKAHLANSPAKTEGVDTEVDPFKAKAQLANSPAKTEGIDTEVDPFKAKAHLANSPAKTEGINTEVDPFKAKAQLANSPAKIEDLSSEVDHFKAKTQQVNSPAKGERIDEFDPFQHKTQLPNSPVKTEGIDTEVDPFKAKTQLISSPAKTEGIDTEVDPFKAKTQLVNSPAKTEGIDTEVNPFKAKTQLPNSPAKSETEGIDTEIDPFKAKMQLASSPVKGESIDDEVDPFKSKTLLANSPGKGAGDKDEDAAKSRTQPDGNRAVAQVDGSATSLPKVQKKKTVGEKVDTTAVSLEGLDALERLGTGGAVNKLNNNPVLLASGRDLGFDDNMFISGTQAFSDPSAWDLLEQFGGAGEAKETNLRKCSLYVKFDPLVKSTLPKTPEKMPAPTQPAPRRAGARQNDLLNFSQLNTSQMNASQMNASMGEESVCLFGTPPKVSRRRSVLSQRRMNLSAVSQTITEEEHAKPIDLLFSLEGENTEDKFLNDPSKKSDSNSATLVDVEESAKYTEAQWQELQQKMTLQCEGQMLARERQFVAQLQDKTATIDRLQEQLNTVTAEKKKLSERMESMFCCVAEYEKTINMLMDAKKKSTEECKSQVEEMRKERDQALEDVQSLDNSFSELHRRYEKMKHTLQGFTKNEETLKQTIKTWQEKVKVTEDTMAKVKAEAEDKIKEIVGSMEKKEADAARVEAELKRTKLHVHSLENSLEQKNKENKELTELCDTLITQMGDRGK